MTFSDDNTHGTIESTCSHTLQFRYGSSGRGRGSRCTRRLQPSRFGRSCFRHAHSRSTCAANAATRRTRPMRITARVPGAATTVGYQYRGLQQQLETGTRRAAYAYACVRRGRMTTVSLHNAQQRRICATRALSAHAVQQGDMVDARRRTSTSTGATSDSTSCRACCRPRGG